MGKRSREKLLCQVVLSITNGPIYNNVMYQIDAADVPLIIKTKTYGCCNVISFNKNINSGVFSTDVTFNYTLDIDMYWLIRRKTNKLVSYVMKRFKNTSYDAKREIDLVLMIRLEVSNICVMKNTDITIILKYLFSPLILVKSLVLNMDLTVKSS